MAAPFASREALERDGFTGFLSVAALRTSRLREVPVGSGVYAICRTSSTPPVFLEISPAGRHKQKDSTVPEERLRSLWVDGAYVVNFGKATCLHERLTAYLRFGAGMNSGHRGGRCIWQLADSADLLVAWKATDTDPLVVEQGLIQQFAAFHDKRPFANLRD